MLTTVAILKQEKEQMLKEIARLQEENSCLKKDVQDKTFGFMFLNKGKSDFRTKFYTGLPNYEAFEWLYSLCQNDLPNSKILIAKDVLLLILMKIRLNLTNQDLAYRFNVSVFHISTVLNRGFQTLAASLQFLVRWPSKDCVLRTLPGVFRPRFSKCRVIIDCTEIFIERARNLTVRALTWSNYKHHNTIKILVGIAPTGAISFLSKAFGGRVSDKVITQKSGFLDLLEHGDLVLADRGFLISEDLAARGASLAIPSFTKGKKQLSMMEVEFCRRLSRVRIHVERAMERIKNFKIISGILPLKLVPQADNILLICAALSNLQGRLVS